MSHEHRHCCPCCERLDAFTTMLRRLWAVADLEMPNQPIVDEAYALLEGLLFTDRRHSN